MANSWMTDIIYEYSWEFFPEGTDYEGFRLGADIHESGLRLHFLFKTAEKAQAFSKKHPSFDMYGKVYSLEKNRENDKHIFVKCSTPYKMELIAILDALKEKINQEAGNKERPYILTLRINPNGKV